MRKKCKRIRKETSELSDFETMGGPLKGYLFFPVVFMAIVGTLLAGYVLLFSPEKKTLCQEEKLLKTDTVSEDQIDAFCQKKRNENHNDKKNKYADPVKPEPR